ncbi:molybdenum cofactor guanylyltransferase MobA [Methylophaga sulfidovorans]|uniref:Molybdenum cofactor guanylyltransferase n=1 Tax=Methylophaga sulfidovorans TaxID=45496 RepID=A0A1I3V4S4_9GAMM|nr:molybdenum cofactor guanylyltransferase MobA [Methylophaga sulfidovorans]SFJ90130.1 molybdopterin-guanine dinucleotide biosynthesis protein MobB/molybdenum cofactor guanylyltransferase,TIGR02665 [Methylophaga sulfidovorans]
MSAFSPITVSGVLLAGGQSRRMGGQDKGLLPYQGRSMASHVIDSIVPQVDDFYISANRHIEEYQSFSFPVITDDLDNFQGPLAGILAVMEQIDSEYLLTVPCDNPLISPQLRQRLVEAVLATGSDIAIAHDGKRLQPVFALIPRRLKQSLSDFLTSGQRKTRDWLFQHKVVEVDFSDQANYFININTPDDLQAKPKIGSNIPVLGFAAFSGTGKTTLLTKLIPALRDKDIRVAVIKHAHHNFDIDKPGKDSYQIREAGAEEIIIASAKMMALMRKNHDEIIEPELQPLIHRLDTHNVDLILVEGFKHENFPKIELNRAELGPAVLFKEDPHIIAIASDKTDSDDDMPLILDINNIPAMVDFIEQFIFSWKS